MKIYKAFIPRWEITIKAKSLKEAEAIAGERYDDHYEQDPYMNEIIIKEVN